MQVFFQQRFTLLITYLAGELKQMDRICQQKSIKTVDSSGVKAFLSSVTACPSYKMTVKDFLNL